MKRIKGKPVSIIMEIEEQVDGTCQVWTDDVPVRITCFIPNKVESEDGVIENVEKITFTTNSFELDGEGVIENQKGSLKIDNCSYLSCDNVVIEEILKG